MPEELLSVAERIQSRIARAPNAKKPEAPLNCVPNCPICGGVGWIRFDVPLDDPNFGKVQPCPNVNMYMRYGERLGLSGEEFKLSWEDFSESSKDLAIAKLAVVNALRRGYGWVYLYGQYGRAKSYALKIAVACALRDKKLAAYVRMASFVSHLRAAFDETNPSHEVEERLDWWTNLPILAIDEVEKINLTEFAREKMFLLFDRRYEEATINRRGVTLMASNLPPNGLDGYLTDRVNDGRFAVVNLNGKSIRPSMSYGE